MIPWSFRGDGGGGGGDVWRGLSSSTTVQRPPQGQSYQSSSLPPHKRQKMAFVFIEGQRTTPVRVPCPATAQALSAAAANVHVLEFAD